MSDWQPAKLRDVHGLFLLRDSRESRDRLAASIVRVCPSGLSGDLLAEYRAHGCDSEKFFVIHHEDISWHPLSGIFPLIACEHELLTD